MSEPLKASLKSPETHTELREFVSQLELKDVQVTRWSGELTGDIHGDDVDGLSADLTGQYRFIDSVLQCKWNVDFPLRSSDGKNIANIEVVLVETFGCPAQVQVETSPDVISAFLMQESLPIAMPYFREAVQSMGMKLGLGSVVIGLMTEPGRMPKTATTHRPPARRSKESRRHQLPASDSETHVP